MTSIQQRAELHRQIWQIANDVRGSVDGWDFKQYVLGRAFSTVFISENFFQLYCKPVMTASVMRNWMTV